MEHTAANRILVVASSTEQARHFVQRIKDLSDSRVGKKPLESQLSFSSDVSQESLDVHGKDSTSSAGSESVPWTITNRYYTADVHFEARVLREVQGHHLVGVPAIVYVWTGAEKFKDQVPDLSRTIEVHANDVEVTLAVRFSNAFSSTNDAVTTKVVLDEEDGLDEFLSTYGFEYIDGDRSGRKPTTDGGGFDDEDASGVPGLPRVIDALSTIMWPSLVQSQATSNRKSRARELLNWARDEEEDDGLKALVSPPYDHDQHTEAEGSSTSGLHNSSQSTSTNQPSKKSRMQREMDELERWLEEEEHSTASQKQREDQEAWTHADWVDMPTTPTIRSPHGQVEYGFEDDFTDFVGAPVEVLYGDRHHLSRPERLVPMHTGASYQSLASFDDAAFAGDSDRNIETGVHVSDEEDGDLPTKQEIEETSRRIFGASSSSTLGVPASSTSSRSLDSPAVFSTSLSHSPISRPRDIPFDTPDSSFAPDEDDEDEDYEIGAFDLSRVLSALQGMKEEISGMQDESERRKAAARVALGLVYGLKKEEERDAERNDSSFGV